MRANVRARAQALPGSAVHSPENWPLSFEWLSKISPDLLAYLAKASLLFAAYFVTAKLGLSIDAVSGFATVVWPPTGIALAAILILGPRYWPGIALAAFTVNLLNGAPFLVAIGISTGNTLEALVGAYLLIRFVGFELSLERVRDVVGLVLLAALMGTAVSATIGTTSLYLGGVVTSEMYQATWAAWWVGDMLGCLIVAPLFLVWSGHLTDVQSKRQYLRAGALIALLGGATALIFRASFWAGAEPFTFTYLIFPFLIWFALRFGQRGNVSAMFVVSLVAIWSTVADFDVLPGHKLSQSLLLLQIFMGVTAVTFMTLAAVVAERERTLRRQQRLVTKAELLSKQRMRLLAINQAKDEFIGLASHQLRTPATGVKQYAGMLLDDYAGKLTKDQREMLGKAYDCNERQIQIINELLAIAQIDAGSLSLNRERVSLTAMTIDVLEEHKVKLDSRKQTAIFHPGKRDITAMVDKARLRMVIENVIDNASKYSQTGKVIEVSLSKSRGSVTIVIEDNGIGLAKKDFPKLFKKFSRIDNPLSTEVGGTGLGLYLAKKITTLHGGTISVTSVLNQGSTFSINLPAK